MINRKYLLDTNIVSETRKSRIPEELRAFLASADDTSLFISALTIGELHKGIAIKRKSDPGSAAMLLAWVDEIESSFSDRIIQIDTAITRLWGELSAERSRPVVDTLLAATAMVHGMIYVTRNAKDIKGIQVPVLNPWEHKR